MKHQRGAVVLLLFTLVFLLMAGVALARLPANPGLAQKEQTLRELQQAREALLAYAVTYEENYYDSGHPAPGYLPCPNLDLPTRDEAPNPPCQNNRPILGRLPRRFHLLNAEVFESIPAGTRQGEEFWYALSRGFQNNRRPDALNTLTPGLLSVDGQTDIVAVIFAPGPPLAGQQRATTDPRDYLEGDNADSDNNFSRRSTGSNDLLVWITHAELATRVTQRVATDLKRILDRAFDADGSYPAELPSTLPDWYDANWRPVTSYLSAGETATLRFNGCAITYTLSRTRSAPAGNRATCG